MSTRARTEQRRLELLLDRLWEIHTGPIFTAAMELWVAGRTDPELKTHLVALDKEVTLTMYTLAGQLLPTLLSNPRAVPLFDNVLAAVRGMAILTFVSDRSAVQRRWELVKREMLAFAEHIMAEQVTKAPAPSQVSSA